MYEEHIAGVITFSTPGAFSHILGKENKNIEKLISRGPVLNTRFALFLK